MRPEAHASAEHEQGDDQYGLEQHNQRKWREERRLAGLMSEEQHRHKRARRPADQGEAEQNSFRHAQLCAVSDRLVVAIAEQCHQVHADQPGQQRCGRHDEQQGAAEQRSRHNRGHAEAAARRVAAGDWPRRQWWNAARRHFARRLLAVRRPAVWAAFGRLEAALAVERLLASAPREAPTTGSAADLAIRHMAMCA